MVQPGVTWGGTFRNRDPVHFDDRSNVKRKSWYKAAYLKHQSAC